MLLGRLYDAGDLVRPDVKCTGVSTGKAFPEMDMLLGGVGVVESAVFS